MTDVADTLIIIPTYNESGNIGRIIDVLMGLDSTLHVLVVDDHSPDGTASVVRETMDRWIGRVHLMERPGKLGLGTAYAVGFAWALERDYQMIVEMDADFSHDPYDVPRLVSMVRQGEADLVIGSRYCKGISIINWPLSRLILSYSANVYARFVTGLPIFDTTAGFKCIHRRVLEAIDLSKLRSNGYSFQIEIHYRAWKAGFSLKELSIIFRERQEGVSKMSRKIMWEAMWRVWVLRLSALFGRL
jgi:dolichol-phosphate mannosyltransferase